VEQVFGVDEQVGHVLAAVLTARLACPFQTAQGGADPPGPASQPPDPPQPSAFGEMPDDCAVGAASSPPQQKHAHVRMSMRARTRAPPLKVGPGHAIMM
jgi:hypothetical protein